MKIVVLISRILLGLAFTVFGLDGVLGEISGAGLFPTPSPSPAMAAVMPVILVLLLVVIYSRWAHFRPVVTAKK